MMVKVAVTGSIGSGKSLVSRLFSELDVPVYHADIQAKRMLDYPSVISKLSEQLGAGILDSAGQIDRKKLAAIVFQDAEALRSLNGIIHPLVKGDFECWCMLYRGKPYILHEAAILIETGFHRFFDLIILVTAPESLRIERVTTRDNISRESVLQRAAFQWPEEEKAGYADYIIRNDGQQLLLPQVTAIHEEILSMCNIEVNAN